MVKYLWLVLLFSKAIHANQAGVITVLEAPLFKIPDENSKVIQYVRKGQKIYIHPSELHRDKYEGIIDQDYEKIVAHEKQYAEQYPDKLFPYGAVYFPEGHGKFYKTLSKSGDHAYILKEHVFLQYKDKRELTQKVVKPDPTDYRIAEPLPEGYPLAKETGFRGQYIFSLGTPTASSYPYSERIQDSGFDYNKEIIVTWSRQIKWDLTRRFFFGAMAYLHHGKVEHLTKNFQTSEENIKVGVGPLISYDVWRNERYTLNFYGAITLNFYDHIEVKQTNRDTAISDSRDYKSLHFSSRVGTQVFIRDYISTLSLVIGANIGLELPHNYSAASESNGLTNWKDSYSREWNISQSYFVGLQSEY
jgi:hypothetical protein